MRLATRLVRWTLLLSMVAVFGGCGDSVVGPPPSTSGGGTVTQPQLGPEIMVVQPDGTVGWTQPPLDWSPPQSGALASGTDPARKTVSARISGLLGGKMQCGRFFLVVEPLSFLGDGTITMSTIDSTIMICDVEISPASLNGFRKPVKLALDTTGLNVACDSLTMYWYDPDRKDWVDMHVETELEDDPAFLGLPFPSNMKGIAATLEHFSRYGGGKAGW